MNKLQRKCASCTSGVVRGAGVVCIHQFHPGNVGGCGTEWIAYCNDYRQDPKGEKVEVTRIVHRSDI